MNTTGLRPDPFARLTCRSSCSVIVAIRSSLHPISKRPSSPVATRLAHWRPVPADRSDAQHPTRRWRQGSEAPLLASSENATMATSTVVPSPPTSVLRELVCSVSLSYVDPRRVAVTHRPRVGRPPPATGQCRPRRDRAAATTADSSRSTLHGAAVADLQDQRVEEHDGVDVIQRPALPCARVIHDRVGDAADQVPAD